MYWEIGNQTHLRCMNFRYNQITSRCTKMPEINLPDAFILIMQSMKSTLENFSIKSEDLVLA